jgi:TIR domain
MNPVFLSHSKHDKPRALELSNALTSVGVPTWVSFRDIKPGEVWEDSIESALEKSSAVVVLADPVVRRMRVRGFPSLADPAMTGGLVDKPSPIRFSPVCRFGN